MNEKLPVSNVWTYATKITTHEAKCLRCNAIIKTKNGTTSTLRRHLISKHGLKDLSIALSSSRRQHTDITSARKKQLDNLANLAIFQDGRSFNDFHKRGIQKFLAVAIPGYHPPHRNKVQTELKRQYFLQKSRLQKELKTVDQLSLTTDFWTDRHQNSYLCVTGHYIDENTNLKSSTIYFQKFNQRHTGQNIAEEISRSFHDLEINGKVFAICCDGATNLSRAFDKLNFVNRFWCFAHRLHLTICNGLALWKTFQKLPNDHMNDEFNFESYSADEYVQHSQASQNSESVVESTESHVSDDFIEPEDEENQDVITDHWDEGVMTADDTEYSIDKPSSEFSLSKNEISELLKKCRTLIKMIRRSQCLTRVFNTERKKTHGSCGLSLDCITRWNSTYVALTSILKNQNILKALFTNKQTLEISAKQKEQLTAVELNSNDWDIISSVVTVLKPFVQATSLLSGSRYPTIGLCVFILQHLKEYLSSENEHESTIINNLKSYLFDSLKHYFYDDETQLKLLMLHGYFDPIGFSTLSSAEKTEVEKVIKRKVKDYLRKTSSNPTTVSEASSNSSATITKNNNKNAPNTNLSSSIDSFLKAVQSNGIVDNNHSKSISEELKIYRSLCNKSLSMDTLLFWRLHGNELPIMHKMAKTYLAVPGTSVPSESAFSFSAYVARKERASLSAENLGFTVFLRDKLYENPE